MTTNADADIVIRGAREHNLRDVSLVLPRNQLIVMTGVSGSGKSSLAFDTLYAEGQRRYVESLSTYARQFLGQMPKPNVDSISGLAPSISIQQKVTSRNPRSTVGTITEVYDYLRVLFARVGTGYCYVSGRPIQAQSTDQILGSILQMPEGTRFSILAPVVRNQKGEFRDLFEDLLKQGFLRARVDGQVVSLTEDLQLKRHHKHDIEVVVDRLVAGKSGRGRLAEAVELALRLGEGRLIVTTDPGDQPADTSGAARGGSSERGLAASDRLYSADYSCPESGMSYEPPTPQLFSFNSPVGMCPECDGLGMRYDFVIDRLVADGSKPLWRGALALPGEIRKIGRWKRHTYEGVTAAIEQDLGLPAGTMLKKTAWDNLPPAAQKLFLYGMGERHITFSWGYSGGTWKHGGTWDGLVPGLLDDYRTARNPMRRRQLEKYMEVVPCSSCEGTRLNRQARHVRLRSRSAGCELSLPEVCSLSIADAVKFFEDLELDAAGQYIAEEAIKEIRGRLGFLLRCGLDYLSLDRTAPTLSGGESQRIRLASQIGCGLTGVVYILDEPSIGLHPRDNGMLLESLCDLRDQGNTVIVVEHDEETMRAADHLVDFGPGPGLLGGEIVAQGSLAEVRREKRSVTGQFLSGRRRIAIPEQRRPVGRKRIRLSGARHNNLRNVRLEIPLGNFVCVTGVSGSGKSSLVNDTLWQILNRDVNRGNGSPGRFRSISGLQHIDKAIDIDQSPIGRTPRSNPATYVKVLDEIRKLFTQMPQSRLRGYKPGRFSFNVPAGRCEACEGHGATRLEMDFLADIWVPCTVCEGRRFNFETLEVQFRGASIAEVLEMDVSTALQHFESIPNVHRLLQTLEAVGLGYVKLGQPSPTLSGGEAQRIKLARELGKRSTGSTLYLLDEPTTGLHFADVEKLLQVLHGFVDAGNTVLVVEHNLDVIKTADWVIDLGPDGGVGGGAIVAQGTPEEVAASAESHTGRALAEVLQHGGSGLKRQRSAGSAKRRRRTAGRRAISIRGAGQHNLQDLDVEIPHNRISVFCGPSGSGKTSLAMDTLYAEGQRRYVESLSAYARQFLGQMPKPRVEQIQGLSPAIAIEQKTVGTTPRSTVGTVTEVYDYLRVLFSRLGQPYCPKCDVPVRKQTTDEIVDRIMALPEGTRLLVTAPQEVAVQQSYESFFERLRSQGFVRVRIDGRTCDISQTPEIDHRRRHDVAIVVDRVTVSSKSRGRIADSVEAALSLGRGVVRVVHCDAKAEECDWREDRLSLHYSCPGVDGRPCQLAFEELAPQAFSFNSPLGWCPACEGLGTERGTEISRLVGDPSKSLTDGALTAWPDPQQNDLFRRMLAAMAEATRLPLDVPWYQLSAAQQRSVLYGTGDRWFELPDLAMRFQYKGLYPAMEEASRASYSYRQQLFAMIGEKACSVCDGTRLRPDAAAVRLRDVTLPQLCRLPLNEALQFLKRLKLTGERKRVAGDLLHEARHRLSFLVDVGLHYLSLDRAMPSLSGGESQRIRLAGQIGRALTGVLYVLDEPTIGLHPRDNGRLLSALEKLRDLGNTVVLVEHDREVLEHADRLFDFGPGAGRFGGTIVSQGTPRQVAKRPAKSLTGDYLSGRRSIVIPETRRMAGGAPDQLPPGGGWLQLLGARLHNLRNVDVAIPLGTLTCVTGVSGSGKSSLIQSTLAPAVSRLLKRSGPAPGPFDSLSGVEHINRIINVDQQPLGTTPASNPATYTGVFDQIRDLFTRMPESRVRGYRPGRFSFNRSGGRCDDCEGMGQKKIEMHFLPDVWVECTTCRGRRYNEETLAVKYRGRSIADVLEMSVGEALELFGNIPKIRTVLSTLSAIGLDYITLGQPAPTLSGGEAQRVKLASELARPDNGRTLYILDEPTTGLHFDDIDKLLKVLNSLVESGNTVVVIEHNPDVIKTADWMIDLGPEAGVEGGSIVACGTPEDVVARHAESANGQPPSHTARILAPVLSQGQRGSRAVFDVATVSQKQKGDLNLAQVGRESKLPWEKDGRRWHTVDRVGHNGSPCRWDGDALNFVIDQIAAVPGFGEPNWKHRSVVEVTSAAKSGGWFLHALTGDEWVLTLNFRVRKSSFRQDELAARLGLEPWDDLDDVHVYGRAKRVRVKNIKGPWQQVAVSVHSLSDVKNAAFSEFLREATTAYFAQASAAKLDLNSLTPWKVLGRKWHLSRKGFPSNKRVAWAPEVLDALLQLVESAFPGAKVDYGNKQLVRLLAPHDSKPFATVNTKRRAGIDLTLYTAAGVITLGQIAKLGSHREITPHRDRGQAVKIRFDAASQLRSRELRSILTAAWPGSGRPAV